MDIKINDNLIKLAKEMDVPLYLVGGYVRDYYLGRVSDDIDICSAMPYEKMQELCKKLKFKVSIVNKRLGTLLITPEDNIHFEYTPFRVENYVKGNHSPESVEFVEDISIDAKRRDFTINSIYINVVTREVFDPYNGINDIKKKVVKAIETPEKVFASDGLRILRLVRFASSLNFKIDRKTLKIAREMCFQLRDISPERKKHELDQIVVAENKYGVAQNLFVEHFNKLNIYKYLLLLPLNKYKIKRNKDYIKYFELSEEYRFVGFMVLFLLNKYEHQHMLDSQVVFDVQNILGNALRCSNVELKQTLNIYRVLQDLRYKSLNVFMARNYHNLTNFEKKIVNVFVDAKPVSLVVLNLHQKGIPLSEKELKITSEEIGALVGNKNISMVKQILLEGCLTGNIDNINEKLVEFIQNNILKTK